MLSSEQKEHILDSFQSSPFLMAYHDSFNYFIIFRPNDFHFLAARIPEEFCKNKDDYYFICCIYTEKPILKIHELTEQDMQNAFNALYLDNPSLFVLRLCFIDYGECRIYSYDNKADVCDTFEDGTIEYIFGG